MSEALTMAEKKYIELEAVLEFVEPDARPFLAERIKSIPAADVRPVVLCKDCEGSYERANVDGDNYRYCGFLRSRWNHGADRMVYDDDFCKWGRKREES